MGGRSDCCAKVSILREDGEMRGKGGIGGRCGCKSACALARPSVSMQRIREPKKQELARGVREGGREGREKERDGEREILTDFAVGIGLFSAGTEVRIPPQQVYSLLLQTQPTGAHSIEL